jgi:1-acyl-sn-glycerol-3-phosphate acyltransferase
MFYFFCIRILSLLARLVYKIDYQGIENIPDDGELIVCSNHKSVVDPLLLAIPFKRQIRYMAKSELFQDHGRLAGRVLHWLGAFPVKRDKGDAQSIRTAAQILNDGGVVGIFPQGRCVFDQTPFKPKAGVVMLASKTGAPILPVSIYCDGVIKPFCNITVRFGKIISYDDLNITGESRAEMRSAAEIIALRVNKMLEEKH